MFISLLFKFGSRRFDYQIHNNYASNLLKIRKVFHILKFDPIISCRRWEAWEDDYPGLDMETGTVLINYASFISRFHFNYDNNFIHSYITSFLLKVGARRETPWTASCMG